MAEQHKIDIAYMTCAFAMSKLSYARRKKVGAIIVSPEGGIIAEGVNGMPSGFSNKCETPLHKTKEEVLHAESNAITKLARSTNSSVGATLYCTLSPCLECAKLIIQTGITRVVYAERYPYAGHTGEVRAMGLDLLEEAKVQVDNLVLHYNSDEDLEPQDEGRPCGHVEDWEGFRP